MCLMLGCNADDPDIEILNGAEAKVSRSIKNDGFVPIIFELVCKDKCNSKLHIRLLQDFLFLLNQSHQNKHAFLTPNCIDSISKRPVGSWQWKTWLFGLLSSRGSAMNTIPFDLSLDFFVILLSHILLTEGEENAKAHLMEIQAFCIYFSQQGVLDATMFCGQLHRRLLDLNFCSLRAFAPPSGRLVSPREPTAPIQPSARRDRNLEHATSTSSSGTNTTATIFSNYSRINSINSCCFRSESRRRESLFIDLQLVELA